MGLNATKDVGSYILNVTQADKIFNELLQIDQDFAFNTLDDITPKCALFKTLFDKLDAQTKADYKIHLQRKTTVLAKLTLRNFYSDNEMGSGQPKKQKNKKDEFLLKEARKVSSYNSEQFKNFASQLEGCVLSTMNPITETVDSVIPEEHTSNSSENESISQDTWSTLEELEDQLPDELIFVQNQQSTEILDEFHRLEKGVSVEQVVKRQRR